MNKDIDRVSARRKKQYKNYAKYLGRRCYYFWCIGNAQMFLMHADGDVVD